MEIMTSQTHYLQGTEAARLLHLTPARISQLVREGKLIPAFSFQDGTPVFDRETIERFRTDRINSLMQRISRLQK